MVPYGYEHPGDRAPSYVAARCRFCGDFDHLTYAEGTFTCSFCVSSPIFLAWRNIERTPAEVASIRSSRNTHTGPKVKGLGGITLAEVQGP